MSTDQMATELLERLDAKAEADLEEIRRRGADLKSRLEQGLLNVRPDSAPAAMLDTGTDTVDAPPPDLSWEFEPELDASGPDFRQMPAESLSFDGEFKEELDVATDSDGIPLGD
jgi:hypothetical protein